MYICMTAQLNSETRTIRTKIQLSIKQKPSNQLPPKLAHRLYAAQLNPITEESPVLDLDQEVVCAMVGPYTELASKDIKQVWSRQTCSVLDRATMASVLAYKTGKTAWIDLAALFAVYHHHQPDHTVEESEAVPLNDWLHF